MSWRNVDGHHRKEKSVTKGLFGGGSAGRKAGKAEVAGQQAATAESRRQFDLTRADFQPFREAGIGALGQQQAILGLQGPEEQAASFAAFQDSPGQAFLRERGEKALLRNQAAIGGLGGGNIRSALQQQGIGFANQQFGEFQNRLAGLAGQSQTATTQGAQIGANLSGQISQGLAGIGRARASGIQQEQAGNVQTAQNVLGLASFGAGFSDINLKENLVKVGELESGLNIYKWTWKDFAKDIVGDQPAFGVIAQDAEKLFPDAVKEIDGYLHVNYLEIS